MVRVRVVRVRVVARVRVRADCLHFCQIKRQPGLACLSLIRAVVENLHFSLNNYLWQVSQVINHPWKIILPPDLAFRLHMFSSEAKSVFQEFPDKLSRFIYWLVYLLDCSVSQRPCLDMQEERGERGDQHPAGLHYHIWLPSLVRNVQTITISMPGTRQ